jgi:ABC-type uncharacterized transport system permease subunit
MSKHKLPQRAASESGLEKIILNVALPLVNLLAALLISAIVIYIIGANPWDAVKVLARGAFGSADVWGYTLYYTTNFIFAGMAVALAFHAGLFNIGVEGQAYMAGLGVALVCLAFPTLTAPWIWLVSLSAAALFGAAWAYIPGWLQAYRGSHVVVTTIMFNFIASALMNYLLVRVLIAPGQQAPETAEFSSVTWLPYLHDILNSLGLGRWPTTPLNISTFLAMALLIFFYWFVWRSRWGFVIRTVGQNEAAARYAGVHVKKVIVLVMCLSGALGGMIAVNDIQGVHHRLLVGFTGGVGFVGIAVALMGRNHPFGILVSAFLFGALAQGGAELSMEIPTLTREMVVIIEGLIIIFCGALENMFRKPVIKLIRART